MFLNQWPNDESYVVLPYSAWIPGSNGTTQKTQTKQASCIVKLAETRSLLVESQHFFAVFYKPKPYIGQC